MPKGDRLGAKQQIFVAEYLVDLNASAAYLRAGYQSGNPNVNGPRLLSRPHVQAAVQQAMVERSQKTGITAERVLNGLASIAFGDLRQLFDDNGNLLSPKDLPESVVACLAGLEIVTASRGEGEVEYIAKVKTNDRLKALELLGKHLNLFKDRQESDDIPMPTRVEINVVDGRKP